jgi:hypothetical protein
MKKVITLLLLIALSATSFSQQTEPNPTLSKQDFLLKSKKQKTTAWILLGGGTGLAMTGLVMGLSDLGEAFGRAYTGQNGSVNSEAAGTVFLVGLGGMVGSIPLFVASGRNKRIAMSLSFKNETTPQIQKNSLVQENIPSLKL